MNLAHQTWIGKLPDDWTIASLRDVLTQRKELNVNREQKNILSVTNDRGVINYKDKGDIGNKASEDIERYKKVYKGDIVANSMNVIIGSVGISPEDGALSPVYIVMKPRPTADVRYYDYIFKAKGFQAQLRRIGYGILDHRMRIPWDNLKMQSMPQPPMQTQQKIADFLDTETAKIDNLIAKQERLLQLLEEKRRATITHAVTRGLDSNVELKETFVPWLGKIPEHWELKKLKHVGESIIGLTYSPSDLADTGTLVLRSMNISNGRINTDTQIFVSKSIPDKFLTKENDLLICSRNGSRRLIGKCGLIEKSQEGHTFGVFNTVFRSKYNSFIYYTLNSNIFYAQLGLFMTSTINQLTVNTLNNFEVGLPSRDEQQQIVEFLNEQEQKSELLTQKIQTQITLLRERRTSLISHAVTGKIKV